jgi:hypothetical protein
MNILIDELPTAVTIAGKSYRVNWGFRTFILIEICIFDQKLADDERISNALTLFYGDHIPADIGQAFEKMMWFYRGGKSERKDPADKGKTGASSSRRCYCFEQDAPFIYSAFRTQYRIDLQDLASEELHWWKFKAMFESLDENLKISKIMGYRVMKTTGMGKEQKAFYNEMRKLYSLDVDTSADSKMKLAKRDADMKNYIKRRAKEAQTLNI